MYNIIGECILYKSSGVAGVIVAHFIAGATMSARHDEANEREKKGGW